MSAYPSDPLRRLDRFLAAAEALLAVHVAWLGDHQPVDLLAGEHADAQLKFLGCPKFAIDKDHTRRPQRVRRPFIDHERDDGFARVGAGCDHPIHATTSR